MQEVDFHGAKIALLTNDNQIVVLLRDDKPDLRFAGMWDLPGGGREGNESPASCAIREVKEELGIEIPTESIYLQKIYPSMYPPGTYTYFLMATLSKAMRDAIVFGGEGQKWRLMPVHEFISHQNAVPDLQDRLKENLPTDTEQGRKTPA